MPAAPNEILETIETAREYLEGGYTCADAEPLARNFAEVITQLAEACPIGVPCPKHGAAVHGQEAEELRAGVEQIVANIADVRAEEALEVLANVRKTLSRLLDHVDARDSLAYLEAQDAEVDAATTLFEAVLRVDIATLPPEVRAARLAYQFPR